ncbi:site-specific DNA-methyltransferase [Candidatus Nomurabacteria bacterium]|nr:site-specific DNA-methyltransferase [Candidatus Nomurabacteria bacterium]
MTATGHNEKDLLKKISELEAELKKTKKQKKYGLVWEEKPEQIVEDCKRNVPILRLKEKTKGIDPVVVTDPTKDENILIEGDNYHALSVLNYTHKEKVGVIYIDPPYNTGNGDFIYNDKFVDVDDAFRHSKWVSFMENRLRISRDLLKDTGLIFISIDDNEFAQLKMLCDGVFGQSNFIASIIWARKRGRDNSAKFFSKSHEYILVYAKDITKAEIVKVEMDAGTESAYKDNRDNDPRGPYRLLGAWARGIQNGPKYEFTSKDGRVFSERMWLVNKANLENLDKENKLIFIGDKVYRKLFRSEHTGTVPETIWSDTSNAANASDEIKGFFGNQIFDTPKPTPLLKRILQISSKKDDLVLDYMAGSGTTGQAVLELNKEDGGNRKFILCTNNGDEKSEHKIASNICYPRIVKTIKGYKNNRGEKIEGLGGNLRYYKTDLVDIERLQNTPDQSKVKLTYQAGEMIGLRENTLNEVENNEWWQIFEGNGKLSAIYFKEDKEKLSDLVELLEKKNKPTALYIFSWSKNEYKSEYSSQNIRVEDIPEPILEVYKEINRL